MVQTHLFNEFISEDICAFFDVWFIGDATLDDAANTLRVMISEATENRKLAQPYLNEFYNIHIFTENRLSENVLAHTLNALSHAVNERKRLLRFLVILLDKDIISAFNVFEDDIVTSICDAVNWFVCQISVIIRRKRFDLITAKPGSIYRAYPAIVFIRMIRRVDLLFHRGSKLDLIYSMRAKFNDALNHAAARIDQHMMTINSCNTGAHFEHLGDLSSKGKKVLWYEVDDLLERFDKKDIKLLPNPVNNNGNSKKRRHPSYY